MRANRREGGRVAPEAVAIPTGIFVGSMMSLHTARTGVIGLAAAATALMVATRGRVERFADVESDEAVASLSASELAIRKRAARRIQLVAFVLFILILAPTMILTGAK